MPSRGTGALHTFTSHVPRFRYFFVLRPQDPTVGWGRSGRAQRSTGEGGDGDLSGDGEGGRGDLGRESENEDADRFVTLRLRLLYCC